MPVPLLGGGDAVGNGFSSGRYRGGKGGGGSPPDPGSNSISGGEDMPGRRPEGSGRPEAKGGEDMVGRSPEAAGRAEGSGRPEVKGAGGGGGQQVQARGGGGRGIEAKGGEDLKGDRGRDGCGRGEASGSCNIATEPEEHAPKRQKMNFNGVIFATPQAQPGVHCSEMRARSSTTSTSSKSSSSSLLQNNSKRSTTARRTLEFSDIPYHQKLHDLFVCPLDLGVSLGSLSDYAARHRKVNRESPPGDVKGDVFLSPVNDTRSLIRRSVKTLQSLHESDKSLGGKFDFSNFRVDSKRRVKLDNIKPGSLLTLRKGHSEADYGKFALQAHAHFFSSCIPSELKGWLKLLLENPAEQEYLIVHSIALMEPTEALAHFLILYGEFLSLKKDRAADYKYVVDYLKQRHLRWKEKIRKNSFTEETFTHVDPDSNKKTVYTDGASDLLRFCRNFVAHILGKHKNGYRISHGDILAIINSVFPELLFDFQTAMHHRGILKRLLEFQ